MKPCILIILMYMYSPATAQALPHGTIYGDKPTKIEVVAATNLEIFMGKRTRISVTVWGMVTRVTKTRGGWFELDAGRGRIISAHFKTYNITIPINLKGHKIIAEGVAQKQFIADDMQHFAGDKPKKTGEPIPKAKPRITFEVKGLMID